MKSTLLLTTLACLTSAVKVAPQFTERSQTSVSFSRFKDKYGKVYPTWKMEQRAFEAYTKNMALIKHDPTMGENKFSDQTFEEFSKTHLMESNTSLIEFGADGSPWPNSLRPVSEESMNVSAWDWRNHGAVTSVKDQLLCGSCWSFSAAGNAEGQWALYNGTLISLSEELLVSCSTTSKHDGCNGGSPLHADKWVNRHANGYWTTDAAYPYTSGFGANPKCKSDLVGRPDVAGARISGWEAVHHGDEPAMAGWLAAHGPIGVCVDATIAWTFYSGGVLTDCDSTKKKGTNHCVLLVGFNNTGATPYWIVKNSWGADWGIDGYMYLEKGVNKCHVAEGPYSAVARRW